MRASVSGTQAQAPHQGRQSHDRLVRWVTGISLTLGAVGAVWIATHRPASPPHRRNRFDRPAMLPPSMGGMGQRGLPRPQPRSRFLANMSTHAGDYLISVRTVRGEGYEQDIYANQPLPNQSSSMSALMLSLQALSTRPEAIRDLRKIGDSLVAVDDTGQRLTLEETGASTFFQADKYHGRAWVYRLKPPAPAARTLKAIEGVLELGPPETRETPSSASASLSTKQLPFRIADVPLPIENRAFGIVAAGYLDATPEHLNTRTPEHLNSLVLLNGEAAQKVRRHFPPYLPEPGPMGLPIRLILAYNREGRFEVPLPAEKGSKSQLLDCRVTPTPGWDGEIQAVIKLTPQDGGPTVQETLRVWDDEPVVLLLPDSLRPAGVRKPLALWFYLFQDTNRQRDDAVAILCPFPVKGKERGGGLKGQIQAGNRPLRYCMVSLEFTRVENESDPDAKPVTTMTTLDEQGRWQAANLSPGRYRVRLKRSPMPFRTVFFPTSSWEDYVARRYGLRQPRWQPDTDTVVTVRPGAVTTLPIWRLVEGAIQTASITSLAPFRALEASFYAPNMQGSQNRQSPFLR